MKSAALLPLVLVILLAACSGGGSPSARPSTDATPPTSAAPSAGASESAEPTQPTTASPTPVAGQPVPFGTRATVVADDLRVRIWPGLVHDVITNLDAGDEVVLTVGPIDVAGYRWYEARFDGRTGTLADMVETGWVASGPTDDDQAFLRIGSPTCPDELDLTALAQLTPVAIDACGIEVTTVSGVLDTCYEGPLSPFTYEPGWVWFSCRYVHEETTGASESAWWYPIHFPPDYGGPELERGDVVVLTGHLGFDASRYGECTVEPADEVGPQVGEAEAQIWAASCQSRFVVTGAEVTGHIDLPPMY